MKYHVAVKFVAIILCAVCLLGAVGSAGGVFVLTEMDLYNKTVDEVLESELQSSGAAFAHGVALHYASVNLGGCPEELASQYYANPDEWGISLYRPGDFGYAILDAQGSVLASRNEDRKTGGKVYKFPVNGQYLHLVSQEQEGREDLYTPIEAAEENTILAESVLDGEYGVFDNLPANSVVRIYGISVTHTNEDGNMSGEGYGSVDGFGLLFRDTNGGVVFHSTERGVLDTLGETGEITHIIFQDGNGSVVYEAAGAEAVGWAYSSDSYVTFVATKPGEAEDEDPYAPVEVYYAQFFSAEDPEQVSFAAHSGGSAIGAVWVDEEGKLCFETQSLKDSNIGKLTGTVVPGAVGGIGLYDIHEEEILHYWGTGNVALSEDLALYYISDEPVMDPAVAAQAASTLPDDSAPETGEIPEEDPEALEPQNLEDGDGEEVPPETDEGENQPGEADPEETGDPAVEETSPEEITPTEGETLPEEETVPATMETVVPAVPEATIPETTMVTVPETTAAAAAAMAEPEEPVLINGKPLTEYAKTTANYYNQELGESMEARCVYVPMPEEYTVELYITEGSMRYATAYELLRIVRNFRNDLFLILGVSLLLFAALAVYLCCAAGHKPKSEEIRAGGLSRVPLDLNLAATGVCFTVLVMGIITCLNDMAERNLQGSIALSVGMAFLASLSLVGLLYAAAAQFKTPEGYWWHNSLCYRIFSGIIRCIVGLYRWLVGRFLPWLGQFIRKVWKFSIRAVLAVWLFLERTVKKTGAKIGGGIRKFAGLLPMTWQWLVTGFVLIFLITIATATGSVVLMLICMALAVGLALYVSLCFGTLLDSVKRMSRGDLNTKVDDKRMAGCFQEFAEDLNALAGVAVVAAQKQLKSERMKTELITNVSHDIKTPLTSIINYVDLLQKPHTGEEEAMYLEVLARQSQRLKKLIEDLMEMSKANTGNMNVDIIQLDAVEAVNQALGEFGDKLDKAQLVPVFRHADESVMMMADGRLTWRVLSNLLGNAVKYAMPGTRLYIDLMQLEGKVVVSLKNISRDELNVEAEELMERFVRGDDSRNTEGSGLGLNIAKSLMELQKGQLQLLVDGDLFKVTLIFPGV